MSSTLTTEQEQAAEYHRGAIAHHEAAHAITALKLGARVRRMRLWRCGPTRWEGLVNMVFDDTDEGNRAAAVALLIGVPTELHWFEAHQVRMADRPHDVHASSARDRDRARDGLSRIPRKQRPTFHAIERESALMVVRHWDRIEHLAARLIDAGQLHDVHA